MKSVDLHFHLLPGVDDGPADMEESVALAAAAVEDGTRLVVATPHVRPEYVTDVRELRDRLRELRARLASERVPLGVRCGGELGHEMVGRLDQAELDSIAQGPPDARWLLLETPFYLPGPDFHGAAAELRERGFAVVLAHPERSADAALYGGAALLFELAAGSLAQINALSLSGGHGEDARRAGLLYARTGLAGVVASDAHGVSRPPALRRALQAMLAQGVPAEIARSLTGSAPRRLLSRGVRPGVPRYRTISSELSWNGGSRSSRPESCRAGAGSPIRGGRMVVSTAGGAKWVSAPSARSGSKR